MSLTSQEYAKSGGTKCPVCGSDEISSYVLNSDQFIAWSDCECENCNSTWQDEYTLTGYGKLVKVSPLPS